MSSEHGLGLAGSIAKAFIKSKLTPLIIIASIILGAAAIFLLPREEEPQIKVPMIDVFVQMPGGSSKEVEERISKPLEKLLWELPGVEYIYSTSKPGLSMTIVRFYSGWDEEDAIVKLNQKMMANFDIIPPGASLPLVKVRSIDDVPILAFTLWSDTYDHFQLRQIAAQLTDSIKSIPDVSEVNILGGQRRQLKVTVEKAKLSAYGLDLLTLARMLDSSNKQIRSGSFSSSNQEFLVEVGGFLRDADELKKLVIAVKDGKPIYLDKVARVEDGPEEADNYVFFGYGKSAEEAHSLIGGHSEKLQKTGLKPAVTITVAKRKGTNASFLSEKVIKKVKISEGYLVPEGVNINVTRDYGETAKEKSDELIFHLLIAFFSVAVLIWLYLGYREATVVSIAVPVTLALTMLVFYLLGFTLNRVTMFALIFSIGILVDDAIVVVENIARHFHLPENEGKNPIEIALGAVGEVGNPTILATFAVMAAILPMAFVRGLMGAYMLPIPVGASTAMLFSLFVAFIVTPWAAVKFLKTKNQSGDFQKDHESTDRGTDVYKKFITKLVKDSKARNLFFLIEAFLMLLVLLMFPLKLVKVKMLPFDNKSEFQVMIDMPEGTPLEFTSALAFEIGDFVKTVDEVSDYQVYVGSTSPYTFNGLIRHYFLRSAPNEADIRVGLVPKDKRQAQSHSITKRLREPIKAIADKYGAKIKMVEVPPGPPVFQTLVAEIYGPDYKSQIELASQIKNIFEETDGVVDVDWTVEDPQSKYLFKVDKRKALINGISTEDIAKALNLALQGKVMGLLHDEDSQEDVPIFLRLDQIDRSSVDDLSQIKLQNSSGNLVALSELLFIEKVDEDKSIYHKNLMPVVYVTADVAGVEESPVYGILKLNQAIDKLKLPDGSRLRKYVANLPFDNNKVSMKWDGEWHITYEVFRDLGLAFAGVLVLIYILVVAWFRSFISPLVIMSAIPFSLIGIAPAHFAMNAFFTATSMIGFIAGAGIVVRNSIILVDFIEFRLKQGMSLEDAVVDAGVVRFRPMLLTALVVVVGAVVILFDPIFQGLAISLMAGEIASLLLSRTTVPLIYYLINKKK
jgi:multidrug efflux pump subunit AcrB